MYVQYIPTFSNMELHMYIYANVVLKTAYAFTNEEMNE
jgi:hypothetical protein